VRLVPPPRESAHGALLAHITGDALADTFQPMNVNFGLFPPPPTGTPRNRRKRVLAERALSAFETWRRELVRALPAFDAPAHARHGNEMVTGTPSS